MPRKARKEIKSKFLHVMIQGINREYIFNKEKDIKAYLRIFKEKLKSVDLYIITYCIMNNHAHFLIFTEDIDMISELMRKVNTSYAIYYNKNYIRCGYVFRDRYKSEEISSREYIVNCIHYIHNNPVKAKICQKQAEYKYSGYKEFKNKAYLVNKNKVLRILSKYNINLNTILTEDLTEYNFIDDINPEDKNKLKLVLLNEFLEQKNITNIQELQYNSEYLKELAVTMNKRYKFTQKEIAELVGLSRLKIHRLMNE